MTRAIGIAIIATLTVAAAVLAGLATAQAQDRLCASAEGVVAQLSDRFGETQRTGGLRRDGTLWASYANGATGTWTILEIHADGTACMVASGQGWMETPPEPKGDPA